MSQDTVFNLDDIVDFGTSLPLGRYVGKVIAIEPGQTQKGDPKVTATFEVLDGEYSGHTIDKAYFLKQGETNGRKWCPGISEIRSDAKALGVDSTLPKSFTLGEAQRTFAKILGKTKLEFVVGKQVDKKDETKSYTRVSVVGKFAGAGSGSSDPLADLLG